MKIEIEIPLEKDDIGHLLRIPDEIISLLKWQEGDTLYIPFQTLTNTRKELSNQSEISNDNSKNSNAPKQVHINPLPKVYFVNCLSHTARNTLNNLIERIKREFDDPLIEYQEHKQHYAIKYNKDRAKAWMVIKLSGKNLFLWIRVNPDNFNDLKNLSKPYRDAIPHGNRQIILNEENFEDIMDLIRQSYEFRKQDNFNELYKKAVLDEFGKIN